MSFFVLSAVVICLSLCGVSVMLWLRVTAHNKTSKEGDGPEITRQ